MDCSADDVLLPTTFSSTAGVVVDSEQVTSVAFIVLTPLLPSVTATVTSSCGSTGHDDDASDAMKEGGGTDARRNSRLAVVRRSGGDDSAWPHTLQLARMNATTAWGASIVTLVAVATTLPAGAPPLMVSVQGSALPSRALRDVALTSSTSHSAVASIAVPLVIAGVIVLTTRCSGTAV